MDSGDNRRVKKDETAKTGPLPFAISIAVTGVIVLILWYLGRIWWCKSGDMAIYVHQAWNSSHTSQHLLDPYTFTHILHGVLFFWLARLLFPRLDNGWRFLIAATVEAAWEVLENTNFIIENTGEHGVAGLFRRSIMNSVGDMAACAVGFWIAVRLGAWRSLIFFFAVEIVLLLWIRDGLLLNILMLIFPIDGIKQWQAAM